MCCKVAKSTSAPLGHCFAARVSATPILKTCERRLLTKTFHQKPFDLITLHT